MKKLKGHKKACKCVGCSAETRKRGMAKLGLSKKRHANAKKHVVAKPAKRVKRVYKPSRKKPRKIANHGMGNLIGYSPVLHISGKRYSFRNAKLLTGRHERQVIVIGSSVRPCKHGVYVKTIDYRHDAKAKRSYGRVAPFRHKFKSAARVISSGSGQVVIESPTRIWEKQP